MVCYLAGYLAEKLARYLAEKLEKLVANLVGYLAEKLEQGYRWPHQLIWPALRKSQKAASFNCDTSSFSSAYSLLSFAQNQLKNYEKPFVFGFSLDTFYVGLTAFISAFL